jgi:hypothetical protein
MKRHDRPQSPFAMHQEHMAALLPHAEEPRAFQRSNDLGGPEAGRSGTFS